MNGVMVVDKPAGPTSHDVVARVRRALQTRRVGHTGTLDPLATGVLPLVIGRATRLARFMSGDDKEYVARVRLGASTPTYDAEERTVVDDDGTPVMLKPPPPDPGVPEAALLDVLSGFRGAFLQLPPPFSAKKLNGTPAYVLARLRKAVDVRPVQVTLREIEVTAYAEGLAELRIVCSSGFYVRSLAYDIGERLGCGAHLEALRRTRAGEFAEAAAVPLEVVEREGASAAARLVPLPGLLSRLPRVVVNERGARRAAHGNVLAMEDMEGLPSGSAAAFPAEGPVRVVDADGALLAIGERSEGGVLQPVVVLV